MTNEEKLKQLERTIQIELGRRDLWHFCNIMLPQVYKENREYLKVLCKDLWEFITTDEYDVLTISMPPRFGKSTTTKLSEAFTLGVDSTYKIMTASYNEDVASEMSKSVRNTIQQERFDDYSIVYSDLFTSKIQQGSGKAKMWSLDGNGVPNYIATSPSGVSTGFGANLIVIDDIIKSAEDALNDRILQKHWDWFVNTMLSRLEGKCKVILIGTRWSNDDLIGRYTRHCKKIRKRIKVIELKAYDEKTDTYLCPEIIDEKKYKELKETLAEEIFSANYLQRPIGDMKARVYKTLETYRIEDLMKEYNLREIEWESIISYTDVADQGNDYFCTWFAGVFRNKLYILDKIYTQYGLQDTESILANKIDRLKSTINIIESNNGGQGAARNVEYILQNIYHNYYSEITPLFQKGNKQARILSNSRNVERYVRFPSGWDGVDENGRITDPEWQELFYAVALFKAIGTTHDDAPDALTGLVENALKLGLIQ